MTLLACACGSGPVDTTEPIALVPDEAWTEERMRWIAPAGDAWNHEFGTKLSLGETVDSDHAVAIRLTEDGCMNERFHRTLGRSTSDPPEILICPATAADAKVLFETVRHELGHVLGIQKHAKSASAVMAAIATEKRHFFQEEDRDLFFFANPRFTASSP